MRGLVALILTPAALGCGMAGEPAIERGEPVPESQVPVLQTLAEGQVKVCAGTSQIAPPSPLGETNGGLCRPVDAPAADRPCEAPEDCGAPAACICGRCVIPYCANPEFDCAGGAARALCNPDDPVCRAKCAVNADCREGQVCLNGQRCVPLCAGQESVTLACTAAEIPPAEGCSAGQFCVAVNTCLDDAGETCGVPPACENTREPGKPCRCARQPVCQALACKPGFSCGEVYGRRLGVKPGGLACDFQRTELALRKPSALVIEDRLVVFAEGIRQHYQLDADGLRQPAFITRAIYRLVSDDGRRFAFDPQGPVFEAATDWERTGIAPGTGEPHVTRDERGDLILLYEGGGGNAIGAARSRDGGRTFERTGVLLDAQGAAKWEHEPGGRAVLEAPHLVVEADKAWTLYYAGGAGNALGRATGGPGGKLKRDDGNPVLTREAVETAAGPQWRRVEWLGDPWLQSARTATGQGYVKLFFAARGQSGLDREEDGVTVRSPANFSIGLAVSKDGKIFAPFAANPVFDRLEGFINHQNERGPSPVLFKGEALWLFTARDWAKAECQPDGSCLVASQTCDPYYRRCDLDGDVQNLGVAIAKTPGEVFEDQKAERDRRARDAKE